LAKLIPVSLLGTDLNNIGDVFCAKAKNDVKINTCRYSKHFLIRKLYKVEISAV
jgi:hypothetical protein